MNKFLRKILVDILNSIGLKLMTTATYNNLLQNISQNKINLIQELQGLYSELIFTDLPLNEQRIQLMSELLGTGISEAIYIVNFLHKSLGLEGDVCEFGVAQGATSALLANEIFSTEKKLWLFDSFQGLPKPTEKDLLINDIFNLGSIEKYEGTMACPIDMVKTKLERLSFPSPRVKMIPGFIEDTVLKPNNFPEKVCFAYVDFDFYQPILTALNVLHQHLSPGGFVVVDDYNWFSSGAKTAVDEFIQEFRQDYEFIEPHKFAGHFCIIQKKPDFKK